VSPAIHRRVIIRTSDTNWPTPESFCTTYFLFSHFVTLALHSVVTWCYSNSIINPFLSDWLFHSILMALLCDELSKSFRKSLKIQWFQSLSLLPFITHGSVLSLLPLLFYSLLIYSTTDSPTQSCRLFTLLVFRYTLNLRITHLTYLCYKPLHLFSSVYTMRQRELCHRLLVVLY